jgi:hypothetical protein
MTKLPDNVNVATLSPEDALAWYQSLAEGIAREEPIDLVHAWTKVKLLYPALAERANIGQPLLSRVEPAGRYDNSVGLVGGTGANGEEREASGKAHLASAVATGEASHLAAAAAHGTAADARTKAGDADEAAMHRKMAEYHTGQANLLKTT